MLHFSFSIFALSEPWTMTHLELKKKRINELIVVQRKMTKQLSLNRLKRFVWVYRDSRYNYNTNSANRICVSDKTNIQTSNGFLLVDQLSTDTMFLFTYLRATLVIAKFFFNFFFRMWIECILLYPMMSSALTYETA